MLVSILVERDFVSFIVFAIILIGKRELVDLLCMPSWCRGLMLWLLSDPTGFFYVLFLLLRYSVLCTVESLSLLYLLFISGFLCCSR